MIQIRNLMFQPLTFHLTGEKTLHLGVRARVTMTEDRVSAEMRNAAARGVLEITPVSGEALQQLTEPIVQAEEPTATAKRRK